MAYVFQYGSNLSTERLNSPTRLRGDARVVGVARTVENYELSFDIWSKGGGCAAADLVEGAGRQIWGVIYEVPDHLIRRDSAKPRKSLDAIEGEGANYRRVEVQVRWGDGREVVRPVLTYLGLDRKQGIKTSLEYVQHIFAGVRQHNFPGEYVQYVRERVLANNPDLREGIGAAGGGEGDC
jgi:cation transport regulator ChaC